MPQRRAGRILVESTSFGRKLRRFRERATLSQEELAERAGLSVQAVGALERGERRRPYPRTLDALARALNLGSEERLTFVVASQDEPTSISLVVPPAHRAPHNLPLPLTSFVGRERELAELGRLLTEARLVTLIGPGGIGKTRLALELARALQPAFSDGVWILDLAGLTDATLLGSVVAGVLAIHEVPGQPILRTLLHQLQARRLLLILDNCEHLIDAAAHLASTLLQGCAGLTLLTTSREALRTDGEFVWRVAPLGVPPPGAEPSPDDITSYGAVRLFLDRARAARADTALAAEDRHAIVSVCQRLDGVPLALELAAAQVDAMTVGQIAAHLGQRFQLLASGSRTAPPRHRTLRATIDWSYDALGLAEQIVFRRLATFGGGFTLEAAEAIAGLGNQESGVGEGTKGLDPGDLTSSFVSLGTSADVALDLLGRLIGKSLLLSEEVNGQVRYRLLETMRQYAAERLEEAGEMPGARERHCAWYGDLARRVQPVFWGDGAPDTPPRQALETEQDNLRAALAWSLESDPDAGLRLAANLAFFWIWNGQFAEGRRWLELLLARSPQQSTARAYACLGLGTLIWDQGEIDGGRILESESIAMFRALGNQVGLARALVMAGHHGGDLAISSASDGQRMATLQAALDVAREVGDSFVAAWALALMGTHQRHQGNHERGKDLAEQSWTYATANGSPWILGWGSYNFGSIARAEENFPRAMHYFTASLPLLREAGHTLGVGRTLTHLSAVAGRLGSSNQARIYLRESLSLFESLPSPYGLGCALATAAVLAVQQGDHARAVHLAGAAEAIHPTVVASLDPEERQDYQTGVSVARAALGDKQFARLAAEGKAMSLEQAIASALVGGAPS